MDVEIIRWAMKGRHAYEKVLAIEEDEMGFADREEVAEVASGILRRAFEWERSTLPADWGYR